MKTKFKSYKYLILSALMILVMIATVIGLWVYTDTAVHDERCVYLATEAETTVNLLNKTITQYSDYAFICRNTVAEDLKDGMNIHDFIDDVQEQLYLKDARLILVDQNGTWYGENRTYGKITALDYYTSDAEDQAIYMTTGSDVTQEAFCYRMRLPGSVSVLTDRGPTEICYATVILYMDTLEKQFSVAFPYNCNCFIEDSTGLMLFKDFKMGILMSGSNVFSKYARVDFTNGDRGEELLARIQAGETVVAEMDIEGQSFFICTSPLSVNDWYISFVIDTSELSTGSYIQTLFILILLIGIVFASSLVLGGISLLRLHDSRKLYAKEKAANDFLEKASKAKGDFLSNMSHDIRTPINGIMGMTAIAKGENNPEKTADCLNKIELSSRYLLSLVNDVLEMSTLENGGIKISPEPLDILELMKNCLTIMNTQAQDKKLQLVSDFDTLSRKVILADPLRLNQIFINILGNAIKFTPEGGTVTFGAREIASDDRHLSLQFYIRDTGIGMEPEFMAHIWDRFSQSKTGARSQYKGTGLGMAITKSLVDIMQGTIQVESELNRGSCFTIELTFDLPEQSLPQENRTESAGIQGARILLAEDNEINLEIATELLTNQGAIIETAVNGKIACELFQEKPAFYYDLILMDMMMPERNGLEATSFIRALDREDALKVPIIAMTANVLDESMEEMKKAGINDRLTKPIEMEKVLALLSSYLHKEE